MAVAEQKLFSVVSIHLVWCADHCAGSTAYSLLYLAGIICIDMAWHGMGW